MGYADFKAKMKSTSTKEVLTSAFEEKSYTDDRYWKPTIDKNGNANCVLRFLPAGGDEEAPYITIYSYAFQDSKTQQWYIENSLQTIGLEDPVAQKNKQLWDTGDELNRDIVRKRRRIQKFVSNVLIIKDPANTEVEGQVKLYKFGKAILNKIKESIKPQFPDDPSVNPYDLWEGADFRLRIFKDASNGYPSYEKCVFDTPSVVFDGDDTRIEEEIFMKLIPLQPEIGPTKFKPYAKLVERLALVEGRSAPAPTAPANDVNEDYVEKPKAKVQESKPAPAPTDTLEDEPAMDPDLLALLADED